MLTLTKEQVEILDQNGFSLAHPEGLCTGILVDGEEKLVDTWEDLLYWITTTKMDKAK